MVLNKLNKPYKKSIPSRLQKNKQYTHIALIEMKPFKEWKYVPCNIISDEEKKYYIELKRPSSGSGLSNTFVDKDKVKTLLEWFVEGVNTKHHDW